MKLTDIFKFKLFERTDPVDMETVNENFESVEKIFDGLTAEDVGALPTSGGILTGPLNIHGMAGEQPLKVSGIVGSDGVGNDDVLYLQLGVNKELILGNEGKYSFSADGGQYTGNAASATKAKQDGNGNVIADTYLTKSSVVNNNTTTEAGYALDARQANPNVDGSLAKQISTLNSGLILRPIYPLYTGKTAVSGTRDVPYKVTKDGYIQFWYQVDDDKNNSNCGIACYIDGTIVHEYFEYHQAGAANENYSALFPVLKGQTAQFHIVTDSVTQSAMIYHYPARV